MRVKLYISPCPNDTFMFDALVNGRIDTEGFTFDVEYHDIEELNERALRGEAHISKISCALLPHLSHSYCLSDSGAALGRGNGPLLVRRKGESGAIRHVAVPGMYTTAKMLVDILFEGQMECTPVLFSEIASRVAEGEFAAGVLIHEGRFVYHRHNLELVADLGSLWEEREGLPLPLGGIVMRNDLNLETRSSFERVLRKSIEYAFENPTASKDYVARHAQEMSEDVISSHISLFVNEYSLSLGDEGRLAIEKFNHLKS